jgi:hypothetical protein
MCVCVCVMGTRLSLRNPGCTVYIVAFRFRPNMALPLLFNTDGLHQIM